VWINKSVKNASSVPAALHEIGTQKDFFRRNFFWQKKEFLIKENGKN